MVEAIIASFDGKTPTVSEIPPSREELQAARKQMDDMAPTIPSDVKVEACDAGGVPGIWFEASEANPGRVVLYFHGGGYNYGSPRNTGAVIERISRAAQARCLGLDYRLCWQAPFPAAVEDATTAYRWLLSQGVDPRCTAVAGDSAGGGLALSLLTVLRDSGLPQPAAGVLTSAWTDLAVTGRSAVEVEDPICNDKGLWALAQGWERAKHSSMIPCASHRRRKRPVSM
jgi:acetyl esterase/lipase